MKKFTSLMLMLLCAVTTWAQISALTELSNDKAYLLRNANDMGYAIWKSGDNLTLCGASSTFTDELDATVASNNWQIVSYDDKYYLYNLGAAKFAVTQKGPTYLTDVPTPISIEAVTGGFAFNSTNDGYQYMCAAHHLTPPVQWWAASDNGSSWEIIDNTTNVTEELNAYTVVENYFASQVEVVFEYYVNDKLYTTETVSHDKNIAPEVPAKDYVTVVSTDVTEITEACTVKVTCEENLPFTASASYATATWYVVDIHSNENNYTWKYVAQDANVETPVTAKSQQTSLGDKYYWAFVGNLVDGFKIYNKAAGADLTLRKASNGNNASVMSATDDRNLFKLHASTAIPGATCFKIADDSYYLNKQNQTLQGWTATDGGSSCRFFTPASFVINALGGAENAPSGAVGSYNYLADAANYNAFNDLYAPIKANQHDIEALVALDESGMVSEIVGGGTVAMTDGYYRIQNLFRPTDTDTKNIITVDATKGTRVAVISGLSDYNNVWQIASAGDGVYTIKNANNGKYMSYVSDNSLVDEASAAQYSFAELGAAQWNIKCEGNNLVQYSSGSLGHWGSVAQNGDGAWYIIPATGVEVTVNEFASICLPFAVETTGDVKAYAVEGTNSTHALLAEKADIPANQGAILTGNGTFTLNIVDAAETDWAANQLVGTTVTTDVEAAANTTYYILANGDNGIGLYPDRLADGTFRNNANKAYLPVTSENAATGYSFVFDWAGTTGIEGVAAEGAQNGKIYDITGREVKAMTVPGLYIINGKKVVK